MTAMGGIEPDRASGGGIYTGQRLVRLGDKGLSLSERLSTHLHHLYWRTPFHRLRLRGKFPLKLIALPVDPLPGDAARGAAMIEGELRWGEERIAVADIDFGDLAVSPGFGDYLQSFLWLRDLDAVADLELSCAVAERLMRGWLERHATLIEERGWRPDIWAWRILLCACHSRLVLSSADLVYRSAALNALARGARHLERSANRAPLGIKRVTAWAGVVAAGLVVQGGELRVASGEAGLMRALAQTLSSDGGMICRSPVDQLTLVELLAMLGAFYRANGRDRPALLSEILNRAVLALVGVTLGDRGLSSWQGGVPLGESLVTTALAAAGTSTRAIAPVCAWGYQRLASGETIVIIDAAPPPAARLESGGCASTLALEMSDGPHRLIVNCGGAGAGQLPKALADGLRTTAAHSTLIVADSNSTSLNPGGSLGRGVTTVDFERFEHGGVEASHDGYKRRYGLIHRRKLDLAGDGRELRGGDELLPAGYPSADATRFVLRFHLAPGIDATPTADGAGALLRIVGGPGWHFRCRDLACDIDDSVWIDPFGRPVPTRQLVVSGEAGPGGASVAWVFRRAG